MQIINHKTDLDQDQKLILAVYFLYTKEIDRTHLRYTTVCTLIYFFSRIVFFNYNINEFLLVLFIVVPFGIYVIRSFIQYQKDFE